MKRHVQAIAGMKWNPVAIAEVKRNSKTIGSEMAPESHHRSETGTLKIAGVKQESESFAEVKSTQKQWQE